jgi:hypothetical protein
LVLIAYAYLLKDNCLDMMSNFRLDRRYKQYKVAIYYGKRNTDT